METYLPSELPKKHVDLINSWNEYEFEPLLVIFDEERTITSVIIENEDGYDYNKLREDLYHYFDMNPLHLKLKGVNDNYYILTLEF